MRETICVRSPTGTTRQSRWAVRALAVAAAISSPLASGRLA